MKPLSNKLRWLLLVLLGIVFIAGTPVLIGYSKGYRFGDALDLIATGGMIIYNDVANTEVYLNGVYVKKSGTVFRNTLIQNLFPRKLYTVRVEKVGYQTWSKELTVEPNLVTEVRVLMLPVPSLIAWTAIPATTTSPSGLLGVGTTSTQVATTTEHVQLLDRLVRNLGQFEVEVGTTTYVTVRGVRTATTSIVKETRYPEWLQEIASSTGFKGAENVRERDGIVTWLKDGNIFGAWVRYDEAPPFFMCTKVCEELFVFDWSEPFLQYEFFPNRGDVLVVATEKGVFAVEIDVRGMRNVHTIIEAPNLQFLLDGEELIVYNGATFNQTTL